MVRPKGNTKTTGKKPVAKAKKAQQTPKKNTSKTIPTKHSAPVSNDKKPVNELTKSEILFKEELESFAENVKLSKVALNSSDTDKINKSLKSILDNITFFLKLLPEVKNDRLLSSYHKIYKTFEMFMNTTAINIEKINANSVDKYIEDNTLDENSIRIEKIIGDNIYFYRIVFFDKNTSISIFADDGKPIISYVIDQSGKRNVKFSKKNKSNKITVDNGFKIEIAEDFDETKYTTKESIIVNKNKYSSYLVLDNYTFSQEKVLDKNIVELLFENEKNINTLLRIKNNKIFDIKLNINTSNKLAHNDNTVSTKNDTNLQKNETCPTPFLFLDKAFPQNKKNILYAPTKKGKSFLSIEVGLSEKIKNPIYIIVDDQDDYQLSRYKKLGNKANIVNFKMFSEVKEKLVNMEADKTFFESLFYCFNFDMYNFIKRFNKIFNERLKSIGINKKPVIDEIAVIENIVETISKESGIDFLCIDSLTSIFGASQSITRQKIERLISISVKNNATLLVIHHTTSNEEKMLNHSAIAPCFDNEYLLIEEKKIDDTYIVKLKENSRDYGKNELFLKQTFLDKDNCTYKLDYNLDKNGVDENNNKKTLYQEMKNIIINYKNKAISFKELKKLIKRKPSPTDTVIKNYLKIMEEEEKLIKKTNGSWKIITISSKK
ncbi:MAG: hypothetical protein LBH44_01855 [Treponema sp.]|jgi:hypothetical protein|nr:hypothetical protein [Treponema sp.]